jgi:hypothetical protein
MDVVHRKPEARDFRMGRECQFCHQADPAFSQRKAIDRLIHSKMDDTAAAHLTEEGYVKHRIAELMKKPAYVLAGLMAKSA